MKNKEKKVQNIIKIISNKKSKIAIIYYNIPLINNLPSKNKTKLVQINIKL